MTDISDHLPVFTFLGRESKRKSKAKPLTKTTRKLDTNSLTNISQYLDDIDWNELGGKTTDDATTFLQNEIEYALNQF